MIKYALKCDCGHRFDSWFQSGKAYDALQAANQVVCPACGASTVRKAPMAPGVPAKGKSETTQKLQDLQDRLVSTITKVQTEIQNNCEDVGDNFAEEARKIHYGEAPARGIYGHTTDDEAKELAEEEVEFARVPWIKPKVTQ